MLRLEPHLPLFFRAVVGLAAAEEEVLARTWLL